MTPLLVAAAGPAAAAGCAPLGEIELHRQLLDLRTALDLDQPVTHAALVDQVADRVPCLTFAPAPRLWASFLVHLALREFDAGRDWTAALATAVHVHPLVDRAVGPSHPMAAWDPPPAPPAGGQPPPAGFSLYVDGEPALAFPYDGAVHLVQLFDGRFWTSALLHDAALPDGWVAGAVELPPHVAAWTAVTAGVGGVRADQRSDPAGVDWLDAPPRLGPDLVAAAELVTALRSPVGFGVDGLVSASTLGEGTSVEGRAGVAASGGPVRAVAGAGVVWAAVRTGAGTSRRWLPFPFVRATIGSGRIQARVTAGAAPAVVLGAVEVFAEATPGPLRGRSSPWRLRIGYALAAQRTRFVQPDTGFRVTADALALAVTVGASWSTER